MTALTIVAEKKSQMFALAAKIGASIQFVASPPTVILTRRCGHRQGFSTQVRRVDLLDRCEPCRNALPMAAEGWKR